MNELLTFISGAASSSCVGRRDVPGPSTDCSVTDGLRWIVDKNSLRTADQPKRRPPQAPRSLFLVGEESFGVVVVVDAAG